MTRIAFRMSRVPSGHVQVTKRRLDNLDAFLEADRDLGVTELAARLGLAKSVVHRLMTALADAEYLAHDHASRRYSLGPKALRLGLVAVGQMRQLEFVADEDSTATRATTP